MEQTVTTSTTKGIIIGLILVILALTAYFLDIKTTGYLQFISYIILIAGIIWSVIIYGKQIDYNSTFGNYFAHGFKIAALVTSIMVIYVIIFSLLFPEFKEKALEKTAEAMRKRNLTQEQITESLKIWKKMFMVLIIGGTLVMYLVIGAIASLIGAGITKKNPHTFEG